MFIFDKNDEYSLRDVYEFELQSNKQDKTSTEKHVLDFSTMCVADDEFLVNSGLHYILTSMSVTNEDGRQIMCDDIFLPSECGTSCAIYLQLLTKLFESYGCEVKTQMLLFNKTRLCDSNGIPLEGEENDLAEFIYVKLHGGYDTEDTNEECDVCRGGGCPHCEPYRFI